MAKGPKNAAGAAKRALEEIKKSGMNRPIRHVGVRDWFTEPDAELVTRRVEVWTLLKWYHERYVLPNLGLRGFFRRLWVRLTGKKLDGHPIELISLTNPWEEIIVKNAIRAAMEELKRCPMAFLVEGEEEPLRCELERDHEGNHRAGSFEWSDEDPLPGVELSS